MSAAGQVLPASDVQANVLAADVIVRLLARAFDAEDMHKKLFAVERELLRLEQNDLAAATVRAQDALEALADAVWQQLRVYACAVDTGTR